MPEHQDYDIAVMRPFLMDGEEILWTGRPSTCIPFQEEDIEWLPFSLFWCLGCFVWEYNTLQIDSFFFQLIGLALCLYGLYLLVGRMIVRAFQLRKTIYAVTNLRVLRLCNLLFDSVSRDDLQWMRLKKHRNGTGIIFFRDALPHPPSLIAQACRATVTIPPPRLLSADEMFKAEDRFEFYNLADAEKVYNLILTGSRASD